MVTTIGFAPTVLDISALTGVVNVRLVVVTLEGVTDTPSMVSEVLAGSKSVPETVTVVPPAAVPEVGEIEVMEGKADAKETETSPKDIKAALSSKEVSCMRPDRGFKYLATGYAPDLLVRNPPIASQ